MRRATLAGLALIGLCLAIPAARAEAQTSMKPRINAGVDMVRKNYQDWFNAGKISAAAGLFHPQAVYINGDGSVTMGRENIEKLLQSGPKGWVTIEPTYESDPSGNLAWATGWSKQKMTTDGKDWEQTVQWLVVLEQSGGKWWIRSIALTPQMPAK